MISLLMSAITRWSWKYNQYHQANKNGTLAYIGLVAAITCLIIDICLAKIAISIAF